MDSESSGKKNSKKNYRSKTASSKDSVDTTTLYESDVELFWRGKQRQKVQEIADLRVTERIRIPDTSSRESLSRLDSPQEPWTNKLIRGDNAVVMNSLLNRPMLKEIQSVGGIKLVYIDPPFLVGTDYNVSLMVGEGTANRLNVVDEFAYRDSWDAGPSAYLTMMYQRLWLIKDLLATDGSVWVHCDWKANFMIRAILNEVFGTGAFRNEIIWYYTNKIPDTRKRQYTNATDTILYYCKSSKSVFNWQFDKREKPIKVSKMKKVDGKKVYPKGPDGKCVYVTRAERTADNVWRIPLLHAHPEMWGYPTQKPMRLLERIILTGTNEGDLVADFFCGSGTSLEVAQMLGRKWIGCDLGKIAIHTCRKRMINVLKEGDGIAETPAGFDILETEAPTPTNRTGLGDAQSQGINSDAHVQQYLFDMTETVTLSSHETDATLGTSFYHPGEFRNLGNHTNFEVVIDTDQLKARVTLTNFGLFCSGVKEQISNSNGKVMSSHVILDNGKLVKLVKTKQHGEQKHILTKKWSDWIDYWAVDFDYNREKSHNEIFTQPKNCLHRTEKGPIFNSEWQAFRTPKKRPIDLISPLWKYDSPGNYNIGVKVIDLFGNETFNVFEIHIK